LILSGMKPKSDSRSIQISRIYKNSPSKTPNRFFNRSMVNFNLGEVQKRPRTFTSVISKNRYPSAVYLNERRADEDIITPEHKPIENLLELPKLDLGNNSEKANFNSQVKKFVRIEKLSKI